MAKASGLGMVATYDSTRLPALQEKIEAEVSKVVRKAAFDIEAQAKINAPVLTGALRNSIYTRLPDGVYSANAPSSYAQVVEQAKAKGGPSMKFVAEHVVKDELSAAVAVAAAYGRVVHEVHKSRSHYLERALRAVEPVFQKAVNAAVHKAVQESGMGA